MSMKKRWFALFTVPLFFVFIVVVIVPFLTGVYYSFVSWDGLPKNPMKFVGFANYAKAFQDTRFLSSLERTTVFTLITMVTVNVLALGFALSGWLLGPWYGFAAGGIGSMLADIFLGYAHYAPGTLVIKGVMALVAALMYEKMGRTATSRIAGGVVSEIIMVLGYFGYASLLLGKGLAAAASIPGNIFQGAVGLVVGVLLVTVLERAKVTEKLA